MNDRETAWRELYHQYGAVLVLFARQWTNGASEAEDVVHDVFVQLIRSEIIPENPQGFLFAAVRNTALGFHRSLSRRRRRERDSIQGQPLFAYTQNDDEREEIEQALCDLSPERREAFKSISSVADMPYQEALIELKAFEDDLTKRREALMKDPIANAADYILCEITPAVGQVLNVEAQARIHQAMLFAGIAYANNGSSAARSVHDPITQQPFEITTIAGKEGWIKLTSSIERRGEAISLEVKVD